MQQSLSLSPLAGFKWGEKFSGCPLLEYRGSRLYASIVSYLTNFTE